MTTYHEYKSGDLLAFRILSEDEYHKAEALMREEGFATEIADFPTVVAIEDGEIVGLISTNIRDGLIIAGPLVLKSDKTRRFLVKKLGDLYDAVLASLGIRNYVMSIAEGSPIDRYIRKYDGIEPYAIEDGYAFFFRTIGDNVGWRQHTRSRPGA